MKIVFGDKSTVECKKSNGTDKILIIISAKDVSNPLKKVNNIVELSVDEMKRLISDIPELK